jgi:polar amino acid transport system substrate-binding protein
MLRSFLHKEILTVSFFILTLSTSPYFEINRTIMAAEKNQANEFQVAQQKVLQLLTAEEIEFIKNSPPLTVCSVDQAGVLDSSIILVNLLASHTKLKFIATRRLAWHEGLTGLQTKLCDILPWATPTEERKTTMLFTKPYIIITRVIVTPHDQTYIADINLYDDKVFAIEEGNAINDLLKSFYPSIKFIYRPHISDALDSVINGEAFASIAALNSVSALFNNRSLTELKIAGQLPPVFDDIVTLATRKDALILNSILNKAISATNPELVKNLIYKGNSLTYETGFDYSLLWKLGIAAIILLTVLLAWNRHLTQLNNKLAKAHKQLTIKSKQLEMLSVTDSLTQTYNRLKMDSIIVDEIKRSERYQQEFSVIMIDIDYFKKINDTYGHLVGDEVLKEFTAILQKSVRSNDKLGRWGGEEFLVICPNTSISKVNIVAEKLRGIIETLDFEIVGHITACFGVTNWIKDDTLAAIIKRADDMMYKSKELGRNKVSSTEINPSVSS